MYLAKVPGRRQMLDPLGGALRSRRHMQAHVVENLLLGLSHADPIISDLGQQRFGVHLLRLSGMFAMAASGRG